MFSMNDKTIVPFLDLRAQYNQIGAEVEKEVLAVLRSCNFIAGKHVSEFEHNFAQMHNARYCVAVNNGTSALHLALWASNVGPGDEVIVPVNTYIATAEAVSVAGAKPVFVDHNEFFNINTDLMEKALTEQTKAVIAVHLYGQPSDMDTIISFCNKHNLILIEDCAQSHLAEYQEKSIGSLGCAGCFSFYPGKNLGACGEAGAVLTNDNDLYERMNKLHQHGVSNDKYYHWEPGHNYRMEEIQAAALNVKLKYIREWTDKRRKNADLYRHYLSNIKQIVCPQEKNGVKHVYHLFVAQVENRVELIKHLGDQGISTGLHYPTPLHLQPAYKSLAYTKGDFTTAERTAERILSLPMFPELTEEQIKHVADKIKSFYE